MTYFVSSGTQNIDSITQLVSMQISLRPAIDSFHFHDELYGAHWHGFAFAFIKLNLQLYISSCTLVRAIRSSENHRQGTTFWAAAIK